MREICFGLLIAVLLTISLYFGVPSLLPTFQAKSMQETASSEEMQKIARGKISEEILNESKVATPLTQKELAKFERETEITVLPQELIFRTVPDVSEEEQKRIANEQRLALLANKVEGLRTEMQLVSSSGGWSWSWGWSQLWLVGIWVFGQIFSTIIKHRTEIFLGIRKK